MFKRIILIVLDSVGIGAAKDADKYDDLGTNTFGHTVEGHEELENFKKLGYYNLLNNTNDETISIYTKGIEQSNGKVIAIIHRTNDDDDKLIVSKEGKDYSDDAIKALTEFQEKYFKSVIIR